MSSSDKLAFGFGLFGIVPIVLLALWLDSPLYQPQPTTARWNRLSRRKITGALTILAFCFWLAAAIFDPFVSILLIPIYVGAAMVAIVFSI